MIVRLLRDCDGLHGPLAKGTEMAHKGCLVLCKLGHAEPVDEEAKEAYAAYLKEQRARDAKRRARLAARELEATEQQAAANRAEQRARQEAFARKLEGEPCEPESCDSE